MRLFPTRGLLLGVVCLLALAGCGQSISHPPGGEEPDLELPDGPQPLPTLPTVDGTADVEPSDAPEGTFAFVHHVEDGDSVVVEVDGVIETVRLIGINAPEQGECLGNEAREVLSELLQDTAVVLESDVEDRDPFGRLLRYVWSDGELINEVMAARGLVIARDYQPNLARQSTLNEAEQIARESEVGMWAGNPCGVADHVDIVVLAIQSDPSGRDEDNLNGEFVIFENVGDTPADLGGFELRDSSSSNRYRFPDGFVVEAAARFVVYVGCGDDSAAELYWCHDGPVWNNSGDEVFLADRLGNIVAYDSY